MHTYQRKHGLYTVGYYHPTEGDWCPLRDFNNEEDAAAYVNYLNGGDGE